MNHHHQEHSQNDFYNNFQYDKKMKIRKTAVVIREFFERENQLRLIRRVLRDTAFMKVFPMQKKLIIADCLSNFDYHLHLFNFPGNGDGNEYGEEERKNKRFYMTDREIDMYVNYLIDKVYSCIMNTIERKTYFENPYNDTHEDYCNLAPEYYLLGNLNEMIQLVTDKSNPTHQDKYWGMEIACLDDSRQFYTPKGGDIIDHHNSDLTGYGYNRYLGCRRNKLYRRYDDRENNDSFQTGDWENIINTNNYDGIPWFDMIEWEKAHNLHRIL